MVGKESFDSETRELLLCVFVFIQDPLVLQVVFQSQCFMMQLIKYS